MVFNYMPRRQKFTFLKMCDVLCSYIHTRICSSRGWYSLLCIVLPICLFNSCSCLRLIVGPKYFDRHLFVIAMLFFAYETSYLKSSYLSSLNGTIVLSKQDMAAGTHFHVCRRRRLPKLSHFLLAFIENACNVLKLSWAHISKHTVNS